MALLSFKCLISRDPLGILSSWNGSVHHCLWPGIKRGGRHSDRVTALSSSRLSGEISPSLSNPSFLQELRLSDNHFTGFIPEELGQLSRLRNMNVSRNSLGGNIPSTFENCTRLQNLNLRRNKSYFFSQRTIFFSHTKSANSTFSHGLSAKQAQTNRALACAKNLFTCY